MTLSVQVKEDGYPDSDLLIDVGLNVQGDCVTFSTEGDYNLPPVYLTPDAARRLGNALHEAARRAEGVPAGGLFAPAPQAGAEAKGGEG